MLTAIFLSLGKIRYFLFSAGILFSTRVFMGEFPF
nr:hypothetical protein [Clostridium novyi]